MLPRCSGQHRRRRRDSSGGLAPEEHDGHGGRPRRCASALGWPRRMKGSGTLGPTAAARRAGAPNVRGGRGRAFALSRASGCARPASSVGPRAFSCELPLRACFGLESCGADLGFESRVCCPAAGHNIGDAGATALAAALQKNTTVTAVNLWGARSCSGGCGGWRGLGTLGPTAAARRAGAPNVRGGRALARSCASGCARPASSFGPRAFSCELPLRACFGLESCGSDLGSGRGCAAPPQATTSATP